MMYFCEVCKRTGEPPEVENGVNAEGTGYIGYRSDMPDVICIKCTRCYSDDKTRVCFPRQHRPATLFDEWTALNQVICPWRSRFDILREKLPGCKTIDDARDWIALEGFGIRYPLLPESIEVSGWIEL